MFEWLSQNYIQIIANYKILLGDLTHCYAVDRLRLFTLILLIAFLIKLILHFVIYYRLRKKYPEYLEETHAKLINIFRIAAQKAKIRRPPRLYQFSNQHPLVFTIGTLKPAIFLAPQLLRKLTHDELEAVLVHELSHIKRCDTFIRWLLELLYAAIPVLIVQMFAFHFVFSGRNSEFAIWGGSGFDNYFPRIYLEANSFSS